MVIGKDSILLNQSQYDFALKNVKTNCCVCGKEIEIGISSLVDEKKIKIKCLECETDNNLLKELGV